MKVGIVGHGVVGTAVHNLFPQAVVYDEPLGIGSREEINRCDIAFLCVPTPMAEDGSCCTAIVQSCLEWMESDVIVIRSTVPVGFTDAMAEKYRKKIVFQPEYLGETTAHPFMDMRSRSWISIGGEKSAVSRVVELYQSVYNSNVTFYLTEAKVAEMAKYMENTFFALKVTFCNEMYDAAQALGVDYHQVREVWLADPRISRSHTFVFRDSRGYGGKCLPKDTSAMIFQGKAAGADMSLLECVRDKNRQYRPEEG